MDEPSIEIKKQKEKQSKKKLSNLLPPPPFRMIVTGPSNSGKTTLLEKMWNMSGGYKNIFMTDNIIIFSSTYGLDDTFMKIKHNPSNVFTHFDEAVVHDVFDQQESIKLKMPKRLADVIIIFEDMASEQIFNRSKLMESLAFKSRHLNVSFIIITQKYTSVSTSLRRNADCTILLQPRNFAELDVVVAENFCKEDRKKALETLKNIFNDEFANVMITYKRGFPKYKKNLTEVINLGDGKC